jgi:hypothetical protein
VVWSVIKGGLVGETGFIKGGLVGETGFIKGGLVGEKMLLYIDTTFFNSILLYWPQYQHIWTKQLRFGKITC